MIQWHWVHSQCWIINPVIHFWNIFITQNCNHWAVTTHFLFSFAPGHVSSTFYLCICLSRYLVKSCNSCLFVSGAFHLMSSKKNKTKHNIFKFHPCFSLCQNFIAVSGWIAVHCICVWHSICPSMDGHLGYLTLFSVKELKFWVVQGHPITYWEAGSERLSLPPPRPKTLLQAAEHDTLLLQVLLWFQIVKMTTTESHIALNYIPGTVRSASCMLTHFLITTRPVR